MIARILIISQRFTL